MAKLSTKAANDIRRRAAAVRRAQIFNAPAPKRERCSYAGKYKGLRAPTCGCRTCEGIWLNASDARARIDSIMAEVKAELIRAGEKHGPANSAHESFGIIYEEFNIEFGAALHANDMQQMREEAVQIAAMAARFIFDVADKGK